MKLPRAPLPATFDGADTVETMDGELVGFEICARGTRGCVIAVKISPVEARRFAERILEVLSAKSSPCAAAPRAVRRAGGS
jgi:hypothetical protein